MRQSPDTTLRWLRPLSVAHSALIACIACTSLLCLCSPASAAIRRSGTLEALVTDNFRTGQSTTRYILRSGRQRIPVRPTELAAEPGDRVAVMGKMREDRLVGKVETTSDVKTSALMAPRKVAVLLITFPGDPSEPWSPYETRSNVFTGSNSARAFYEEESYGKISL